LKYFESVVTSSKGGATDTALLR